MNEKNYRCAICLAISPIISRQRAHIIDEDSEKGRRQVRNAARLGILRESYEWRAPTNGIYLCPNCHVYFAHNYVALSLPIPVLRYIRDCVSETPNSSRKPLHEVFDLLMNASSETPVGIPDPKAILPFLGVFTMITLNPPRAGCCRITPHLPNLSIIRGHKFIKAPSNVSATANSACRVFEPSAIDNNTPENMGVIPLSPQDEGFNEKRYWRLPVPAAAVLAAIFERLPYESSQCEDIRLAHIIRDTLNLQRLGAYPPDGAGGSGYRHHDDGQNGGGRGSLKRTQVTKQMDPPKREKGKLEERLVGVRLVVVEYAPLAQSKYGEPNIQGMTSSNITLDHDASERSIDTRDLSISAIEPHDPDNPDEWQFGPSFSTDMIVLTARAVTLT